MSQVAGGAERRPGTLIAPRLFVPSEPGEYTLPPLLQEFFLPVWHQVRLTGSEVRLVNHPAFARLADFYQLGQTHLVYRGATHRRWEHAVGTLHAAQLFVLSIERNHREADAKEKPPLSGQWRRSSPLSAVETVFVRLAALLHDIGHIAAGHTFEDELGLLDKHDADGRLTYVLDRRTWRGEPVDYTLREVIDSEYGTAAAATGLGLSPTEIFLEIVSKSRTQSGVAGESFRMRVCRDLVGNTICADLLDYIHRDWHHLGKPRQFDARLLDYFEIREHIRDHTDVRLVVNLREGAEVRLDAVTAIFELLESRYQLGEIALFHRTKLSASAMLERLVAEIADARPDAGWFQTQIERFLESSDEEMVALLAGIGQEVVEELRPTDADRADRLAAVLDLARRLRVRRLHKQVIAFNSFELAARVEFVRAALGGAAGAEARLATARSLEDDFLLPRGSAVIYCPPSAVHAKIAEVQVLVHETVDALSEIERKRVDPALTGGLLAAQGHRFDRLWRVQVSVSPEALEQMTRQGTLADFEEVVEVLVLKRTRGTAPPSATARVIAARLLANPEFPAESTNLLPVGELAGRAGEMSFYPSGAPTLCSLWVPKSE